MGQQLNRWWRRTLIDSERPLVSTIPDSDQIKWRDRFHLKDYLLTFHTYVEHKIWTLYATLMLFLVRAAPGLQGGLELELLWASTLVTPTELALDILLYLDTFFGLL